MIYADFGRDFYIYYVIQSETKQTLTLYFKITIKHDILRYFLYLTCIGTL